MRYLSRPGRDLGTLASLAALALFSASAGAQEDGAQEVRNPRMISPADLARLYAQLLPGTDVPLEHQARRLGFVVRRPGLALLTALNVEFEDEASCRRFTPPNVHVLSRFGRFADVFVVGVESLDAVLNAPGVRWVEPAGDAVVLPPRLGPRAESLAPPLPLVRDGIGDQKGAGVVIALVDTGIDFRNPDFVTTGPDGAPVSRLIAFWDTLSDAFDRGRGGTAPPVRYPGGIAIGTVYTREQLNRDLSGNAPRITQWDTDGHGTACAGIAAGSGRNSPERRYAGVAPAAELVAVRIGSGPALENGYLLGAVCDWLESVVGRDRPLVISCSFGYQRGGRDGQQILERQLAARYPETTPGRVLCIAAGNEGVSPFHAAASLTHTAQRARFSWTDLEPDATLSVHCATTDPASVTIVPGEGVASVRRYVNPLSRSVVAEVRADRRKGELWVVHTKEEGVNVDAFIHPWNGGRFTPDCARYWRMVSVPGMCPSAISVGSYNFNDTFDFAGQVVTLGDADRGGNPLSFGVLSAYSNPGVEPADGLGLVKPEVAAPGQYFVASSALNAPGWRDSTGNYRLFNGTSAATPYTAGVVALLLGKQRGLTVAQIKELIRQHAGRDDMGPVPNRRYGHGRLDANAVDEMLQEVPIR